jgi:hypothetical protein
VAYIGAAKETYVVRPWADGKRKPGAEAVTPLGYAHHVAELLAERTPGCGAGLDPRHSPRPAEG